MNRRFSIGWNLFFDVSKTRITFVNDFSMLSNEESAAYIFVHPEVMVKFVQKPVFIGLIDQIYFLKFVFVGPVKRIKFGNSIIFYFGILKVVIFGIFTIGKAYKYGDNKEPIPFFHFQISVCVFDREPIYSKTDLKNKNLTFC